MSDQGDLTQEEKDSLQGYIYANRPDGDMEKGLFLAIKRVIYHQTFRLEQMKDPMRKALFAATHAIARGGVRATDVKPADQSVFRGAFMCGFIIGFVLREKSGYTIEGLLEEGEKEH